MSVSLCVCAFAMLFGRSFTLSEGAFLKHFRSCLQIYQNVYMHFNGTFEINKYQNKGLYGYGVFLVLPLQVHIVLAVCYWRIRIPRDLYAHSQVKEEKRKKNNNIWTSTPTKTRRYPNEIVNIWVSKRASEIRMLKWKRRNTERHTSTFTISLKMENKSKQQRHITFTQINVGVNANKKK